MNSATVTSTLFLPTYSLWRREVVRFLRQRSRVIGALGTPIVFWLLIGSGLGRSFRAPGGGAEVDYLAYFFPGTLVLIVLFTSIFSMISIIEDRQEGFLQAVMVAPVQRLAIVLGKVLGSTTLAVGQALVFLAFGPLSGVGLSFQAVAAGMCVLILIAVGLSSLGFLLAWVMDSTQGFHAMMNLFLLPMWMLSGSLFPLSGAASWVGWLMRLNPLSYGLDLLRIALRAGDPLAPSPSLWIPLTVTVTFALSITALASIVAGRTRA